MLKTQKTMDCYFKSNNAKNIEIKRYFYLIWENGFKPNLQAYWTDTRPEKVNYIEQINCNYIKKGYYFYICGYFSDIDEKYNLNKELIYNNVPYLKSHLQKCIRKQNDNLAIPTALHMMKLDLNDFLRRIIIIMLEDVSLHESLTTLVWLMIAVTKNFKMKKYIYEWLLGIIYVLCKIDEFDYISLELHNEIINTKIIDEIESYNILKNNELSILYSIHIRITYGGMEGDMKMLRGFTKIWYERFKNKSKNMYFNDIRPIKIKVSQLNLTDWDLSAIDFHCNSKFIEYILKKYEDLTEKELRKLVWINSSSINKRKINEEYNIEKWNKIKDYVLKTQKYLLESSY